MTGPRLARHALRFCALAAVAFTVAGCPPRAQVKPEEADRRDGPMQEGVASWYGAWHHGKLTASGQPFDKEALTAAHRTLKFGTCVRVRRVENGREVQVRINDRGPYAKNRVIDVSEAAARRLDMIDKGVARVQLFPCR